VKVADLPFVGLGPCAFCDHPDAGHRVRDAIAGRYHAGESLAEIAADYELAPDVVERLIDLSEADEYPGD
jgi:hypothetical protein